MAVECYYVRFLNIVDSFNGTTILDAVSYEGDTGAPFTEGSGAGLTDSGATGEDFKGIARFADGTDLQTHEEIVRSS